MRDPRRPPFYVQLGSRWVSIPFEEPVSGPLNPILRSFDYSALERRTLEMMKETK